MKLAITLLCITIGSAGLSVPALSDAGFTWKASERCMMKKINAFRARRDLRHLDWDKHLGYVARLHAVSMAKAGRVWHDEGLPEEITRWQKLSQNTGRGGRCTYLFKHFKKSSVHRHNMLGRWRYIGVGSEWRGNRQYMQQIFERKRNPGNIYHTP